MTGWMRQAACKGMGALFFPPPARPESVSVADERRFERRCKQVCHTCPVIEPCLEYALKNAERCGGVHDHGVSGGANRWEREWIAKAAPWQIEALHSLAGRAGRAGAQRMRRRLEMNGPAPVRLRRRSQTSIAAEHAVPVSVAKRWLRSAGEAFGRPAADTPPWARRMLERLADGPAPERDLVDAAMEAATPADAARIANGSGYDPRHAMAEAVRGSLDRLAAAGAAAHCEDDGRWRWAAASPPEEMLPTAA